jgi:hypothetical protein
MMELTDGGPLARSHALPNGKGKSTDVRVAGVELYLLHVTTRMPLQFGAETLRGVTCARARVVVTGRDGRQADGWGETPLNVEWAWPGVAKYADRSAAMLAFCECVAAALAAFDGWGHPLEIGVDFQRDALPALIEDFNATSATTALPLLAALVCTSPFDLALHDAFGRLHGVPTYDAYHRGFLTRDLAALFAQRGPAAHDFRGLFPADFLTASPPRRLLAWHMVGGLDPLEPADLTGHEPTAIPCCSRTGLNAMGCGA